jgi:hypothetical protein
LGGNYVGQVGRRFLAWTAIGRSKTWLKTKCFTEGSLVIIGTARDRKTKAPLALLGRVDAQGLALQARRLSRFPARKEMN